MLPRFFIPLMPVLSIAELPSMAQIGSACYVHEKRRIYVMDSTGWQPWRMYADVW
jgi:hypothetical protein